ncbi:hypothetical protein Ga0466249_005345 [Sporomusaceae bacterium BoRhaA]|nr:hypothetical protein [Pelorhabdus rhamnosifermentans]
MMGVNVGHPIRPIQHMTEANQAKLKEILIKIGAMKA